MDEAGTNRVCSVCGNPYPHERAVIPADTPPGLVATLERFVSTCYRVPVCPACVSLRQRARQAGAGPAGTPSRPPARMPYSDPD